MVTVLGNSRRPDVTFRSNGLIEITARVVRILGITQGAVIDIVADDDGYLYLYVMHHADRVIGRHQAQCYRSNRGGNNMRCHSVKLCRAVLDKCGTGTVARLPLGEPQDLQGYMAMPIITGHNLHKI